MKNAKICGLFLLTALLICISISPAISQDNGMTNEKMDQIIKKEVEDADGQPGNWQLMYGQRLLLIITDEENNRMRIFSPVVAQKDLEEGQLEKMLEANFHSALDAKYSLYENYVVSVFTHPLKELTDDQFVDAMRQVVFLADTFGTTYSSTDLIFGGGSKDEGADQEKRINKKPGKSNG